MHNLEDLKKITKDFFDFSLQDGKCIDFRFKSFLKKISSHTDLFDVNYYVVFKSKNDLNEYLPFLLDEYLYYIKENLKDNFIQNIYIDHDILSNFYFNANEDVCLKIIDFINKICDLCPHDLQIDKQIFFERAFDLMAFEMSESNTDVQKINKIFDNLSNKNIDNLDGNINYFKWLSKKRNVYGNKFSMVNKIIIDIYSNYYSYNIITGLLKKPAKSIDINRKIDLLKFLIDNSEKNKKIILQYSKLNYGFYNLLLLSNRVKDLKNIDNQKFQDDLFVFFNFFENYINKYDLLKCYFNAVDFSMHSKNINIYLSNPIVIEYLKKMPVKKIKKLMYKIEASENLRKQSVFMDNCSKIILNQEILNNIDNLKTSKRLF